MLNLVRSGPRHLIIASDQIDYTIDCLTESFNVVSCIRNTGSDFKAKFEKQTHFADEKMGMLFVTESTRDNISIEDAKSILLVSDELDEVLLKLLNTKDHFAIKDARIGTKLIIMKAVGDMEKVLTAVINDVDGRLVSPDVMLDNFNDGTLIAFTKGSINEPVGHDNIYHQAIYTPRKYSEIIRLLRIQNLKYLNAGIDNKDWSELKIKIYDSYGHYDLHYKRLMFILDKLDLGLVLGEAWGTDAATIFYSVGVYKVRLFTFLDPLEIKKVLIGLEFLEDGTRLVDYDLFIKRKKIHWDDVRIKGLKSRDELCAHYRRSLISRLKDDDLAELMIQEKAILKTKWTEHFNL